MRPRGRPPTPTIRSSSAQPERDDLDVRGCRGAEPLDRAVSELLLDPSDRCGHMTVTFDLIQASRIRASTDTHYRTDSSKSARPAALLGLLDSRSLIGPRLKQAARVELSAA